MSISQSDVEHVANLARVELTDSEKQRFTEELGEILNYIEELNKADTAGIEPISQISGLDNIARADEITNENNREKLLENTPDQSDGFIKVKKVFE